MRPRLIRLPRREIVRAIARSHGSVAATPSQAISGLQFPDNAASVSNPGSVRFRFTGAALPPIFGTSGNGLTYLWRYHPLQHAGYYTTFFWGNDDGQGTVNQTFLWNAGGADSYYGFHPYPEPPSPSQTNHVWEISVEQNDFLGATVTKGQWYKQGGRVRGALNQPKEHEFYWNLPNTTTDRILRTSPSGWGNLTPPSPALTFGDAPWQPSVERGYGIHRGWMIFDADLALQDMIDLSNVENDADALSLASSLGLSSSWWYLNMNPADENDISDKSGAGHHPAWWNANRPIHWTQ